MNTGIRTYYALKTFTKKRFFWSRAKETTEVVSETQASNWMWAQEHFKGVDYDKLVLANPIR
jgi:hypothetical protein